MEILGGTRPYFRRRRQRRLEDEDNEEYEELSIEFQSYGAVT